MKYKKKPVAIDAIQWTGDNISELRELDGFTEVHARLGDELIKQLREEGNWLGFTERLRNLFNNAAEAIEERDRRILTLQHEMMVEAESHTALVERLSKQNKKLEEALKTALDFIPCWIPVTEQLPEEHVFVLIRQDDDRIMVAERVDGDWWYRYFAYDVDRWDENEQGTITHWMPLPEPPKEET